MVLMDRSTRGTRQGIIKHVLRIRPIAPLFRINVVYIGFLLLLLFICLFCTLRVLVSLTSSLANLGVNELMLYLTCWWVHDTKYGCVEVPAVALL
jgi:hypothetical protein